MTQLDTAPTGDIDGLVALAQTYFDAAYDMDADKFASIFHGSSSVTRRNDDSGVVVTPIAAWLEVVRGLTSPREAGGTRADRILSLAMTGDLAMLQLRLRIPPREVTDLLSCAFVGGRWQVVRRCSQPSHWADRPAIDRYSRQRPCQRPGGRGNPT